MLKELVSMCKEGIFVSLKFNVYDTKEKKTKVREMIRKVVEVTKVYKSQNIPVVYEDLNL